MHALVFIPYEPSVKFLSLYPCWIFWIKPFVSATGTFPIWLTGHDKTSTQDNFPASNRAPCLVCGPAIQDFHEFRGAALGAVIRSSKFHRFVLLQFKSKGKYTYIILTGAPKSIDILYEFVDHPDVFKP